MNLEQLQERVKELEDTIVQATANLHALFGRKAEVMQLVEQLKKHEECETKVDDPLVNPETPNVE